MLKLNYHHIKNTVNQYNEEISILKNALQHQSKRKHLLNQRK